MDRSEIIALLNRVITPVYQIEADLGMPKTTLQKAISGKRKLPKKWAIKLQEVYGAKFEPVPVLKPKEEPKSALPVNILKPKNLEELKLLCPPDLTGLDRSEWIRQERQKYGI